MARVVAEYGAVVPALFRCEMQSAFVGAVKRKRLSMARVRAHLCDLDALGLQVDTATLGSSFETGMDLVEHFGLTPYDAAY